MGASGSVAKPAVGSVIVPGTENLEKGSSAIRRAPGYATALESEPYDGVNTLYSVWQRGLSISRNAPCMGHRTVESVDEKGEPVVGDFAWMTWQECQDKVDAVGSAITHLDLAPLDPEADNLRLVGIFSKNRYEWVITEQACNAYGAVSIPLYDTLGLEAVTYILQQTGVTTVFADKSSVATLLGAKQSHAEDAARLVNIIQFEDVSEEQAKEAADSGIILRSLAQLMEIGIANKQPHSPPKPDDVATFCYTSGTTGAPKGAMLTHGNVVADLAGANCAGVALNEDDVHLSYLPLAHMFERLVQAAVWLAGARVGFFQGSTPKLMDDLKCLRPTLFPSVPRLFNKIYDKVVGGVESAGGMKAYLFKKGFAAKQYWLERNEQTHSVWDPILFNKIKTKVGLDRCKLMLTGSAPIAAHVMEFLRIVFGCPILEGYGQTESAAAATLTSYHDQKSMGHVGGPLANNEIKLVSVPEMDYLVTDRAHGQVVEKDGTITNPGIPCEGRGEICYRGPNIFLGYFKNPEKTAEAKDAEGWLHSGDIGMFTPEGNIKIVDRKKNIFKLSQGEYIAAEKIENIYQRSSLVAQIFVYGDSLQSCLVAIVVPEEEAIVDWASKNGVSGSSLAELCKSDDVKKAIEADMKTQAKAGGLKGFENARGITLFPELFTVENDLLTPTFKLKRPVAKRRFQADIDMMYASGLGVVAGRSGLKQGDTAGAGAGSA